MNGELHAAAVQLFERREKEEREKGGRIKKREGQREEERGAKII